MEEEDRKTKKTVRILRSVANDVAAIFPYFLAFYLISLVVSIFFSAWRGYFYWPAFHLSIIFLALISLGSDQIKTFWNNIVDISHKGGSKGVEVVGRGAMIVGKGTFLLKKFLVVMFCVVVIPAWGKVLSWKRNLGRFGYYKLVAIFIVLTFSLFQGIYVVDFFVLLFGLSSVLFGLDMRISAGCAIALLAACPLLLVFNKDGFAETAAIYAYYFLVIAVFTGAGDYLRGKAVGELSTGQ
jgi:hypothetical protein